MDDEVEVDNVDLTVADILPEIRGSHPVFSRVFCAVVKDRHIRGTRQNTCLQLKKSWNVVKNRKEYSRNNIVGTWPIVSNL